MGIMDLIDRENLVCTFCGKKPVVGVTFAVDAELEDGVAISHGVDKASIIATCKEHLPILQEQFEKDMKDVEVVELDEDNDN